VNSRRRRAGELEDDLVDVHQNQPSPGSYERTIE
jgi:hypothetical protein